MDLGARVLGSVRHNLDRRTGGRDTRRTLGWACWVRSVATFSSGTSIAPVLDVIVAGAPDSISD